MMDKKGFSTEGDGLQAALEALFRALHAHPELSKREFETTRRIREALAEMPGVELLELGLPTGVLARVRGRSESLATALRADIDALPIREETSLEYRSQNPGVMHACGHDFHTTALLGAAALLGERRERLPGTVYLLFQPSEESGSGAADVMAAPAFAGLGLRRIVALHAHPGIPVGTVRISPGAFSAAVDRFEYRIVGVGGHGGVPSEALDPIPPAARLVCAIQEIVSRRVPARAPAVVSVTRLASGTTWNIVPDVAELEGTARSFDPEVRALIRRELEKLAASVRFEGYGAELAWEPGCDATSNDPGVASMVRAIALDEGFVVEPQIPEMSGEDFAFYQQRIPGALFHMGVGTGAPLHSPRFVVDPAALAPAARLLARIGEAAVGEGGASRD